MSTAKKRMVSMASWSCALSIEFMRPPLGREVYPVAAAAFDLAGGKD
jgi:hypothetical protein